MSLLNQRYKIVQTLVEIDLPAQCKGSREEWTQRNKRKNWHSQGFEPSSSACGADALSTKLRVIVGRNRILIPTSFETSNPFRRFRFLMCTFLNDMMSS